MASDPAIPPFQNSDSAPFIYFDTSPAHGIFAGAVQIELAARQIIPSPEGGATAVFVPTARLRCSPVAAMLLRDAIDSALKMLQESQSEPSAAASKLN